MWNRPEASARALSERMRQEYSVGAHDLMLCLGDVAHPLAEPELDRLSNILTTFNDLFGEIAWDDRNRVGELITKTIPAKVAADTAFRNARENSDDANARIEHDKVLARIVTGMVKDDAELFKQFMDNEDFRHGMTATVFEEASLKS